MTTSAEAKAIADITCALLIAQSPYYTWHVSQADGGVYYNGFNAVNVSKAYIVTAGNLNWVTPPAYNRCISGYDSGGITSPGIVPYDTCSPPYVLDPTNTFCTLPPPPAGYVCEAPKEWILTTDNHWKCVLVSAIPETNIPNETGVYGTGDMYHTTEYLSTQHCDIRNTYECVPVECFWTEKIQSVCGESPI